MTDIELLKWIELRLRRLRMENGIYTLRFWDIRGEQARVTGTSLRNCVENAIAGVNVQIERIIHE